ncbi:hypothetical protein HGP29_09830 [Flammeovirga sp. SR4]|uniref:Uncharacterized protein n=1 Tax=Flammeovirga agarivorans TaxID=2726742 RepID=A0A7X8SJR4_9BACT|nr:hypothetical protein [Flammeovirga agarivorans]
MKNFSHKIDNYEKSMKVNSIKERVVWGSLLVGVFSFIILLFDYLT